METVNLRSKRTESKSQAILAIWEDRVAKVLLRKTYEKMIEESNQKLQKEIKEILEPICTSTDTPIEFIIEANRCIVQVRFYSNPKAKGEHFVTYLTQSIPPISTFLRDKKMLDKLGPAVKKSIRRMNTIVKKNLGRTIGPKDNNPTARIQDMKRHPDELMVVVSYNIRTRYDF